MKQLRFVLLLGLMCGLLALPAFAQRAGAGRISTLKGKVVDVRRQNVRLMLYVHAPSADASGKVPDELAQQAARLIAQANELERRRKSPRLVQQLREQADELQRWREIEYNLTATANIPIIGIQRLPLSAVPLGIRVRLSAFAEGAVQDNQIPERLTLNSNLTQVGAHVKDQYKRLPQPARLRNTFFELVGEVVNVTPLTLRIDDRNVEILPNPTTQHLFSKQLPGTIQDLQPGRDIFVRAQMGNWSEIDRITRVLLPLDGRQPPSPEEDIE